MIFSVLEKDTPFPLSIQESSKNDFSRRQPLSLLVDPHTKRALEDSNPRHPVLETDVLPTELRTLVP